MSVQGEMKENDESRPTDFFRLLGKLAGRAIYFTNVFSLFYFFNGRLSSPRSSDANGAIFTKISGLVDRCKGLLTSLSFF